MKKILAALTAVLALVLAAGPAAAKEEKDPNKLFSMLTEKLGSVSNVKGKLQEDKNFKEVIKYTCQKGNMLSGVFGVCRSAEGAVCGLKKEAYVACSIICGSIASGMKEAEGFAESKCVTKHGNGKWGFANHKAAIEWAKTEVKTKASTVPALVKVCGAFKKVSDKLPAEAKQFEEACP
jgi:hypothetical protein